MPRVPACELTRQGRRIAPGLRRGYIGIRPGEKLHEVLVSEDEARNAVELEDMFIIQPPVVAEGKLARCAVPDGFRYTSDSNSLWLTVRNCRN